MPEGIITMQDMEAVFSVTDSLGIHRESVSVELTKEDPGSVRRNAGGKIEITLPESTEVAEFVQKLQVDLEAMGYTQLEEEDGG
jgi:hypothetical protein